jgi:hypothetical protein
MQIVTFLMSLLHQWPFSHTYCRHFPHLKMLGPFLPPPCILPILFFNLPRAYCCLNMDILELLKKFKTIIHRNPKTRSWGETDNLSRDNYVNPAFKCEIWYMHFVTFYEDDMSQVLQGLWEDFLPCPVLSFQQWTMMDICVLPVVLYKNSEVRQY